MHRQHPTSTQMHHVTASYWKPVAFFTVNQCEHWTKNWPQNIVCTLWVWANCHYCSLLSALKIYIAVQALITDVGVLVLKVRAAELQSLQFLWLNREWKETSSWWSLDTQQAAFITGTFYRERTKDWMSNHCLLIGTQVLVQLKSDTEAAKVAAVNSCGLREWTGSSLGKALNLDLPRKAAPVECEILEGILGRHIIMYSHNVWSICIGHSQVFVIPQACLVALLSAVRRHWGLLSFNMVKTWACWNITTRWRQAVLLSLTEDFRGCTARCKPQVSYKKYMGCLSKGREFWRKCVTSCAKKHGSFSMQ